ncbi:MAG: hypothetical protein H6Q15_2047 [Bacteroidetes bacterium]|nr:hypothetical protein [Bacteroidota bacterium]
MKKICLIIFLSMFCIVDNLMGIEPTSGKELIEMMREKYQDKFYKTLCFSQQISRFKEDTVYSTEVMHEAYKSPGNLILKFRSWDCGDGLVFANDSLYTINDGVVDKVEYRLHDILVLGIDVYNVDPEVTIANIKKLNYNLDLITTDKCMGKDAWLVGDPSSNCFWVDKDNLLFLKVQTRRNDISRSVEFINYEYIEGAPVATTINFYDNNGKLTMVEKYFDVRPFAKVDSEIFDPKNFVSAKW